MDRTKSPVQTDGKSLCLYMFQCICFKVKSLTNLVSCHQKVKIPGFRWRPRSSHFKSLLKMPQNGFTFTIQPKKMSVTTHIVEDVHLQSCFRLCMKLTSLSEPIWIRKHTLLRTHTNKHVIQGRHAISEGEESECISCPGQVLWVFWDSVLCSRAKLCSAVFWKLIHFKCFWVATRFWTRISPASSPINQTMHSVVYDSSSHGPIWTFGSCSRVPRQRLERVPTPLLLPTHLPRQTTRDWLMKSTNKRKKMFKMFSKWICYSWCDQMHLFHCVIY